MYNILCSYGIENYSYDVSIYTQQWERLGEWKHFSWITYEHFDYLSEKNGNILFALI